MSKANNIFIPRDVLLVEIERRCRDPHCAQKALIGLTKEEARAYCGFECERCGKRWNDCLTERDVPDWWEELTITGLHALREKTITTPDEPNEVVTRLSENFRRIKEDEKQ
jgi:RES domain-containing protein